METLTASFNGIDVLHSGARRCVNCGGPQGKWHAPLKLRSSPNLDFSLTNDGYWIASSRFRDACERLGVNGANYQPLGNGMYVILPARTIRIRQKLLKTNPCAFCGVASDVRIDGPPRLAPGETPPSLLEMTRSDLEYGSLRMRHFVIWVGADAAAKLRAVNLDGLQFALHYTPGAAPTHRVKVLR